MITNSKKQQLIEEITSEIRNCPNVYPPSAINGPAYNELCNNISHNMKETIIRAFTTLIDDLYTQEQFEEDIGLKS